MRSDIYTATAMSNDATQRSKRSVHKLWQAAMLRHQDQFVVHFADTRSKR